MTCSILASDCDELPRHSPDDKAEEDESHPRGGFLPRQHSGRKAPNGRNPTPSYPILRGDRYAIAKSVMMAFRKTSLGRPWSRLWPSSSTMDVVKAENISILRWLSKCKTTICWVSLGELNLVSGMWGCKQIRFEIYRHSFYRLINSLPLIFIGRTHFTCLACFDTFFGVTFGVSSNLQ